MKRLYADDRIWREDRLRLIGLSRIPRCSGCGRFEQLERVHRLRCESAPLLPPVPRFCTHTVCAPLVARILASEACDAVAAGR